MRTIDHLRINVQADTAAAVRMGDAFARAQRHVESFERSQRAAARRKRRVRPIRNVRDSIPRNAPCPAHPDRKFKHCPCYRPPPEPAA
jgi:hypothetical protein